MKKRVLLVLFFLAQFQTYSQDDLKLRDSILKYRNSNPSLAIQFGLDYQKIVASKTPDSLVVGTHALIGEILSEMGLYASAINFFNRALELYDATPNKNKRDPEVSQPPWVILNIGNVYLQNGDFEKAKEKYNTAIELFKTIKSRQQSFFGINTAESNLGLVDERNRDFIAAEIKYTNVYNRRKELNKPDDIIYSLAQLIAVNLLKGDTQSANNKFQELEEFYNSEKNNHKSNSIFNRNYGYAVTVFAAYNQSIKKYKVAINYLEKAKDILKDFPGEIAALGSRFAECYYGLGDYKKAEQVAMKNLGFKDLSDTEKKYNYKVLENIYRAKDDSNGIIKIKDSLLLINSGANNSLLKSLNNLETKIQLSNSAKEINENKIRYNTYLYVLIICTVILFFSLMTIRVNYNFQKEKGARLELEKRAVENELEKKNRELISKTNFIIQRNDYLKSLKKKIEKSNEVTADILRLKKELTMVISSEKSYQDFDNLFVEVYPEFYKSLSQITKLSKTDLRLASYIKMNHNNDEIAQISGISIRSVESQRYRLSKKLKLDEGQDLNSFILSV